MNAVKTVAVTGSTGYIGSFVVAELLARGYNVNAPVRGGSQNPNKTKHLLQLPNASNLRVFDGGDLSVPGSFDSAFLSADAVIHTAAEVVLGKEQSIITASVEGTRNVLSSVDKAPTVKRFVQTSSVAAIQRYDKPLDYVFTETDFNDWSTVERGDAYGVAKTTAERLVVSHFEQTPDRFCVALNPGVVIGPVFTKQHTKASPVFLREIVFNNKVMNFPSTYVDVRDVAIGHVNAMEKLPAVNGQRFILCNDAGCLEKGAIDLAKIATPLFPNFSMKVSPKYPENIMSIARPLSRLPLFGGMIMSEVERLGQSVPIHFSNAAARDTLGVNFRPLDETVKEGIESMVSLDLVKLTSKL